MQEACRHTFLGSDIHRKSSRYYKSMFQDSCFHDDLSFIKTRMDIQRDPMSPQMINLRTPMLLFLVTTPASIILGCSVVVIFVELVLQQPQTIVSLVRKASERLPFFFFWLLKDTQNSSYLNEIGNVFTTTMISISIT